MAMIFSIGAERRRDGGGRCGIAAARLESLQPDRALQHGFEQGALVTDAGAALQRPSSGRRRRSRGRGGHPVAGAVTFAGRPRLRGTGSGTGAGSGAATCSPTGAEVAADRSSNFHGRVCSRSTSAWCGACRRRVSRRQTKPPGSPLLLHR
jgi:hypothetical protein